jgi:hypothetical protein
MGRVANTNLSQEAPMTDAMMSLKGLIEKTQTPISCGR